LREEQTIDKEGAFAPLFCFTPDHYTLNGINLYILQQIEKSGWWVIRNVLILEKPRVAGSQLPRTLVRG